MKYFVIDFEKNNFIVDNFDSKDVLIEFDGIKNYNICEKTNNIKIEKFPISYDRYQNAFFDVMEEIKNGNTYLLNLTFPTKIKTNLSLREIFFHSCAKFKIKYKNSFVSFSPERFVRIENNKIYTYPMKGTIDASVEDAKEKLLNNQKELAEHTMVVDLLRNDISMIAQNVKVTKFRYTDIIEAGDKKLIQTSSEIVGDLPDDWVLEWKKILLDLLPAGSITGAPKKTTTEIIKKVENYDRGFYTGIFGIFDEKAKYLDSAVIIRYIENKNNCEMVYKSGGGITAQSEPLQEYREMIDKVYIPSKDVIIS